ncbi:MAG: S8 family serine peptidase [Sphingomonas sp.]
MAVASMVPAAGHAAEPDTLVRLDEGSAIRLARMRADGAPVVAMTAIAAPSKEAGATAALRRLGASVRYRDPETGLLVFTVPIAQVTEVLGLASLEAASIDNDKGDFLATMETRWLGSADSGDPRSWGVAPSFDTKAYPALSPAHDMNGAAFRARDVRFDGRGVVIAHVEDFPDFLSPELQAAKDGAGREVRKFLDIVNVSTPSPAEIGNPTDWRLVPLGPVERKAGDDLPAGVRAWRRGSIALPPAVLGRVRLAGRAEELRKAAKAPLAFPLLWDEEGRRLWLDLNQDGSFRDDAPTGLFADTGEIGVLGIDDAATAVRESVGFGVQAMAPDRLSLNFGMAPHNTWTAAAMAGSKGTSGRIEGVAPGAQIVAISRGTTIGDFGRALIAAYRDPRVDIVLIEGYGGITNIEGADQQRSLLSILVARLMRGHPKLTFMTGGNETAMQTLMAPGELPGVISVSAEQSRAAMRDNYGALAGPEYGLHEVGSAGPAGNGALKPDILSPAVFLSAYPGFLPATQMKGTPTAPPGYRVCGGTSCATPAAAGGGALLLGAARLQGLPADVPALLRAIREGARFLPNLQAYEQGHGLIDLEGAWGLLASPGARFTVAVEGPVALSGAIPRAAARGPGLFEREGWTAGQSGIRALRLLRTGGPRAPVEGRAVAGGGRSHLFRTTHRGAAARQAGGGAVPGPSRNGGAAQRDIDAQGRRCRGGVGDARHRRRRALHPRERLRRRAQAGGAAGIACQPVRRRARGRRRADGDLRRLLALDGHADALAVGGRWALCCWSSPRPWRGRSSARPPRASRGRHRACGRSCSSTARPSSNMTGPPPGRTCRRPSPACAPRCRRRASSPGRARPSIAIPSRSPMPSPRAPEP